MRKVLGIFPLIACLILLGGAMNRSFINQIKADKYFDHLDPKAVHGNAFYKTAFVNSDRWAYGDLYGVSFLHRYKFKLEPFKKYIQGPGRKKTGRVLYIIGDSFLADKTLNGAFDGFDNVIFMDRRFPFGPIRPDTSNENVLLLEFAERNLNGYAINETDEIRWTAAEISRGANFSSAPAAAEQSVSPASVPERISQIIFNQDLSRNLELMLFDNKFCTPFKEAKAWMNDRLFGRVAKEVALSTDQNRLLFNITVDTASRQSAFRVKSELSVDSIVRNLDIARAYYRAIGFKKVYLSVIPNPVSVYDDRRMPYNHLLERIEQKTGLPTISVYKRFKADRRNLFYRSDSHWNPAGLDTWIKETNDLLKP